MSDISTARSEDDPAVGREELTLDIDMTVDDLAAYYRYVSSSSRRLLVNATVFLGIGLYFVLMIVGLNLAGAIIDGHREAVASIRHYLETGAQADLVPTAPWIVGGCVGLFVLNQFVFMPRQCRALARRALAGYRGIAASDPTMRHHNRYRFDARGVEIATHDERVFASWRLLRGIVESKRYLYLVLGPAQAVVVPKAAVDAAALQDVRKRAEWALAPSRAVSPR